MAPTAEATPPTRTARQTPRSARRPRARGPGRVRPGSATPTSRRPPGARPRARNALLGGGTAWSTAPAGAILGVTADHYTASSLLLKAVQDDLGVVSPVVTVVSPNPVDPARLAQASIVGTSGQHLDVFEADASAGAGGSSVGVAGAVALNLVDAQSLAQVTGGASVTVTGSGAVGATGDNETSTIARAVAAVSRARGA